MAEETRQSVQPVEAQRGANLYANSNGAQTNGSGAPAPPQTPKPLDGNNASAQKQALRKRLPVLLVVGILAIVGLIYGVNYFLWSRTHVSTDDAYVTGNLVNVSPIIGGTLAQLTVGEGDHVKKGQLLARIDDAGPRAALAQAQAAYENAVSQVAQAESSYAYQKAATEAAIARANSALQTNQEKTRAAQAQVALASGTTRSQIAQAQSQVRASQAQAVQVTSQIKTAEAALTGARQGVETAERGVRALEARLSSAQADLNRANRDEERYRNLLAKEAVTQQQYDVVAAQQASSQSALRALQQQINQSRSQAAQARANVAQAEANANAAREAASAAREQVGVAQAGFNLARANEAQVGVQNANAAATASGNAQAEADIATANAGKTQNELRRQQIETARAAVRQAEAVLKNVNVTLRDTNIYASTDGIVVRKTVNQGVSLAQGQTILTMTQGEKVFVTANFKETQVANVRIGQPVEIQVDAFPGKRFAGVVGSINEVTGATTSLLPPDNATGNFTKVVQRIPIKIALTPAEGKISQEDLNLLRQGMSAIVTIDTQDRTSRPERVPKDYDKGAPIMASN